MPTLFVFGRENKRLSCTLSVLAKNVLGAKAAQTRKHSKSSCFRGICLKPEMTPFFEKGFVGRAKKVVFTNCILEKLHSAENTLFIVLSARHFFFFCILRFYCFCGLFLSVWCSCKCVENACFLPLFWGPSWGGCFVLVYLGLEGLG